MLRMSVVQLCNLFVVLPYFRVHGSYDTLYSRQQHQQRPSLYQPLQFVNFELMDSSENLDKSRYDLTESEVGSNHLPLLSRGQRETDFDEFLDGEAEPSCRELKKMWRLARKIHNKALETNEIPRKVHPFSSFRDDRIRNSRKFRQRQNRIRQRIQEEEDDTTGSKEEEVYGTVSYTPGETVKRPLDPVRTVQSELRADSDAQLPPVNPDKNAPAWSTGIRMFETAPPKPSAFDNLHSQLRQSQGLAPLKSKEMSRMRPEYAQISLFEKPRKPSPLDILRDQLSQADGGGRRGRLNYRDETSGSIQAAGSGSGFGSKSRWARRKHLRRQNKNRRRKEQALTDALLLGFRNNSFGLAQGRKNDRKKNLRRRNRKLYKNLLMKAK